MIIKKSEKNQNKYTVKMSKKEWITIGKEGNWFRTSQYDIPIDNRYPQICVAILREFGKYIKPYDIELYKKLISEALVDSGTAYNLINDNIITKKEDNELFYNVLKIALRHDKEETRDLMESGKIERNDIAKVYHEDIDYHKTKTNNINQNI